MSKERVEKALGRTITAVHDADNLDESTESPELLAREAARGILDEYDEEPEEVMEAADGFVVASGGHAIFMGHDGSFDLVDLPAGPDTGDTGDTGDTDDEDLDDGDDKDGDLDEGTAPEFTLDGLQVQVEALLSDADPSDEKLLQLLRTFDEAKASGDNYASVEAAKAVAEAVGKEFIPTPPIPPEPKKPVDVGPGPGKSTGTGGGGQPKVGVPTGAAPAPKKPHDTGPGAKPVGEGKKVIQFKFPATRVQEFIEIAQKAGAGENSKVVREGDGYTVTLDEAVGRAIAAFFKGDDVVQESLLV